MLNQKREFFSFKDDAKEYDPSRNSPPKLTRALLDFVTDVSRGLLLSIVLIVASLYFRPWGFTGWILIIISTSIMAFLFCVELVVHELHKSNDLVVDTERGRTLESNLDVSFPAFASSVVRCRGHHSAGSNTLTWLVWHWVLEHPHQCVLYP